METIKKMFDVKTVTDTYTDKQTGEVKKVYSKVGIALQENDGRISIKLNKTFNPAGCPVDNVWLNLFEVQPKKEEN